MNAGRPVRVVHLLAPVAFGGGEALLTGLIAARRDDLWEAVVTVGAAPLLSEALVRQGTTVRALGSREAGSERAGQFTELGRALPLTRHLRTELQALRPDVIHAHGFPPSLLGALPLRRGVRRVYTHHYERTPPGAVEATVLTTLFNRYHVLTTPADHLSAAMNGHFPRLARPFRTLRIALDEAFFDGTPQDRWRHLLPEATSIGVCVGRLVATKNQQLIVDALAALPPEERSGIGVLLVGTGPQEAELRARVTAAGLDRHVAFVGQVDRADMPDLLASADFGLFPTTTEASSLAAAEALAAGLPIVALDIASMAETCGPAGIHVAPDDFGSAMSAMSTRHRQLHGAARQRAEAFRMSTVRGHWAQLYLGLTRPG